MSTFKIYIFFIKFRSNVHTFFDASFWDSFFEFLVRLGAKKVDFGSPLAPSWAPNGAQNRPSGAKWLQKTVGDRALCHPFSQPFPKIDLLMHFGRPLAHFWFPFGSVGCPLAPCGSLLVRIILRRCRRSLPISRFPSPCFKWPVSLGCGGVAASTIRRAQRR